MMVSTVPKISRFKESIKNDRKVIVQRRPLMDNNIEKIPQMLGKKLNVFCRLLAAELVSKYSGYVFLCDHLNKTKVILSLFTIAHRRTKIDAHL